MSEKKFNRIFLYAAFYVFAWFVLDLLFRQVLFKEIDQPYWSQLYLKSVLMTFLSAIAFLASSVILARISKILAVVFIGVFSILLTMDAGSNYFSLHFFKSYLSKYHISFVAQDPRYILDALLTYPNFAQYIGILLLFSLFAVPAFVFIKSAKLSLKHFACFSLSLTAYVLVFLKMVPDNRHFLLLPNINSSVQTVEHLKYMVANKDNPLVVLRKHTKLRLLEPRAALRKAKTIVVVINESWGKDFFPHATDGKIGMPLLNRRLKDKTQNFYSFERAFTNSTATDVSWPSLLTGVAPGDSTEILHFFPMISNLAKKSNYKTALFSSWRLDWANMMPFLQGGDLDTIIGANELGLPIVNDLGIDDVESSLRVQSYIRNELKETDDAFFVYATNGLHQPYQVTSKHMPDPTTDSRYEAALAIVDHAIDGILVALEETGRLDDALIIMTGDHGDGLRSKNNVVRITSFYDYYIRIPFLVKLPNNFPAEETANLIANQSINIQNMDIAPSIAQLLGYCSVSKDQSNISKAQSFCYMYKGQSIFSPVEPERTLIALNTNDVRKWMPEGFGLLKNNLRVLFSSVDPQIKAFDSESDPEQVTDIWPTMNAEKRTYFEDIIKSEPHLTRITKSHAKNLSQK